MLIKKMFQIRKDQLKKLRKKETNLLKIRKKGNHKQGNKSTNEKVESLSIDVFRVDEFGNIISAGKVSKKAKIEILADNKKIIGTDNTAEDGSFVVFGKVQSTGLVQTVKIRGLIENKGQEKIVTQLIYFLSCQKLKRIMKKN